MLRFIQTTALLGLSQTLLASTYYVDNLHGSDFNDGTTPHSAWRSLLRPTLKHFKEGDALLFRSGDRWDGRLKISASGSAAQPVVIGTFVAFGDAAPATIRGMDITGSHLRIENLVIDLEKLDEDAVVIDESDNLTLDTLEIKNGTKDGIDIRDSHDVTFNALHIHHFLAGSFSEQKDAHGIVASNTQTLTIENTEIHHTSGDSFQADPARVASAMSNEILIRNSHFWTSPLEEDFNAGWKATAHLPPDQRQYPGENAIDTKVVESNWDEAPRLQLDIDGLKAHGWKADSYISNKAVFNLKEKVAVRLRNIDVYDCEIAFRLRGNRGNAEVSMDNAHIQGCLTGIRAEDGLQALLIKNSEFGPELRTNLEVVGDSTRAAMRSWTIEANIFHGRIPAAFKDTNRRIRDADN